MKVCRICKELQDDVGELITIFSTQYPKMYSDTEFREQLGEFYNSICQYRWDHADADGGINIRHCSDEELVTAANFCMNWLHILDLISDMCDVSDKKLESILNKITDFLIREEK